MTDRERRREERGRGLLQLPLLVLLVVLWMLLWGSVSWLNLVTGIVVALLVSFFFYLPPVEFAQRFNPYWFLVFLVRFGAELVLGSFQVAYQALRPGRVRHNSIVAVRLRTGSDFLMTLTGITLSLVPGSLVIEADRLGHVLYLHVLNTRTIEQVELLRRRALGVERRLALALGSRDDVRKVRQ